MKFIFRFICVFLPFVSSAQPVFLHSQIPAAGSRLEYNLSYFGPELSQEAGPNQSWDFSGLNPDANEIIDFFSPSDVFDSQYFPLSNLVMRTINNEFSDTSFTFCHYNEESFYIDGSTIPGYPEYNLIYQQPYKNYIFPLNYSDAFSGETSVTYAEYFGFDGIDSFKIKSQLNLSATVDGWGNATIGNTEYEVLKVNITEMYTDSNFQKLEGADFYEFIGADSSTSTRTEFIAPDLGIVVCTVVIEEEGGFKGETAYHYKVYDTGTILKSGSLKNEVELRAYPNPASDNIFLDQSRFTNLKFNIVGLSGTILAEGETGSNAEINTSDLTNGYYFLRLFTSTGEIVAQKPIIIKH
ncbi:MAG: T9SS type A sorting domain-containing protein [Bacteroidetes bacterium]|nr:T9SS type A sorting domain-containing protein [Bacteroidota bacterium]